MVEAKSRGENRRVIPTEMDTGRWWAVKSVVTRAWIVQKGGGGGGEGDSNDI